MAVYEIKNPEALPPDARPRTRGAAGVPQVYRLQPLSSQRRRLFFHPSGRRLSRREKKSLQQLVQQTNRRLLDHDIPIHLVLHEINGSFSLDLYDCTDRQLCRAVHERAVLMDDLPTLLAKLQQEAGIFLDIFS